MSVVIGRSRTRALTLGARRMIARLAMAVKMFIALLVGTIILLLAGYVLAGPRVLMTAGTWHSMLVASMVVAAIQMVLRRQMVKHKIRSRLDLFSVSLFVQVVVAMLIVNSMAMARELPVDQFHQRVNSIRQNGDYEAVGGRIKFTNGATVDDLLLKRDKILKRAGYKMIGRWWIVDGYPLTRVLYVRR